jgi:hypothetical protein
MLARLVAPAPPNRSGGEAPGATPVFGRWPAAAAEPPAGSVAPMSDPGEHLPTGTSVE